MIKLHYYGKTCFQFSNERVSVLINPEFVDNKDNFKDPSQIKTDIIVLTKYKEKNLNDVITIAKNNKSIILASNSIINKLRELGIDNDRLVSVFVGKRALINNEVYFNFTHSLSDSNMPGTLALGVVITIDGVNVYHDGYTAYYSDLKLLKEFNIDYALITVSSKDIVEAKKVISDISPKFFIPMNYKDEEVPQLLSFKDIMEKEYKDTVPVILSANSGIVISDENN